MRKEKFTYYNEEWNDPTFEDHVDEVPTSNRNTVVED